MIHPWKILTLKVFTLLKYWPLEIFTPRKFSPLKSCCFAFLALLVLSLKFCSLVPRLCFPFCCILCCYQMEQLFLIATRCTFASFRIQPNQIVEMSSSFHFFGYSTECPIDHIIFLVSGGKGLFPSLLEQELATVLVRFLFKCTRFHISAALKFFRSHWDGEDRKLLATVYFQQNWVNVFLCFSEKTQKHKNT